MKKYLLTFLFFVVSNLVYSQQLDLNYYIPSNQNYDENIPTPMDIIGHEVGEWHITHDKLAEYMKALAKSSDRISIEDRGKTYEGRPLLLLTITTPNNHSRIDEIRQKHIEATNDSV